MSTSHRAPRRRLSAAVVAVLVVGAAAAGLGAMTLANASTPPDTQQTYGRDGETCTTSSTGYCTVSHGLGTTPEYVGISNSGVVLWGVDNKTSATFRVRFAKSIANNGTVTPYANTAVRFDWVAVFTPPAPDPTTPPPTTTQPPTTPPPTTQPPAALPHDPAFVGPSYYSTWSAGPSASSATFPICAYHMNLAQWSALPARLKATKVNCIYMAYDRSDQANLDLAAANGFSIMIAENGTKETRGNAQTVVAYAMQDEPNSDGSPYAPGAGTPSSDVGANRYVADANAQKAADPTRPLIGNFTKDLASWASPPSGWTTAQFEQHNRTMMAALNITSADMYGWTDPWEWTQRTNTGTGHYGAWIYGESIDRQQAYRPGAPHYGFVECCADGNSPPGNTMMPGMIDAAIWNTLAHGARGYTIWPRDFYHADDSAEVAFSGEFSLWGDHDWDTQEAQFTASNTVIQANAAALNSPTVSGVSATGQGGVPVAALGKDVAGKLWLLVQADGDASHPLSNTTAMTATVTLPDAVPAGTVLDVVGEGRTVTVNAAHQVIDTFVTRTETPTYSGVPLTYGYAHHIYSQP